MPTVQVPVQLTVDHLMTAVKQLSSAELHEFMQQLAAWQQHDGQQDPLFDPRPRTRRRR